MPLSGLQGAPGHENRKSQTQLLHLDSEMLNDVDSRSQSPLSSGQWQLTCCPHGARPKKYIFVRSQGVLQQVTMSAGCTRNGVLWGAEQTVKL